MTAEQIIDHIRSHPDHPPTISTAEWQSVLERFNGLMELLQLKQATIEEMHRADLEHIREAVEINRKLKADLERALLSHSRFEVVSETKITNLQDRIQRLQSQIAQLLDEKKQGVKAEPKYQTIADYANATEAQDEFKKQMTNPDNYPTCYDEKKPGEVSLLEYMIQQDQQKKQTPSPE